MPPLELRSRVTQMPEEERFAELGKSARQSVIESLPGGWTFDGKRVLDFGCGAGRVLRWFTAEAERCEFLACEIDAASVAWLEKNLSPRSKCSGASPSRRYRSRAARST